jgi:hypothetical protein
VAGDRADGVLRGPRRAGVGFEAVAERAAVDRLELLLGPVVGGLGDRAALVVVATALLVVVAVTAATGGGSGAT